MSDDPMFIAWTIPTDGEPTGQTYPLRTETLHDIALLIPADRIPQCLTELMACVCQLNAFVQAMRETGQPEDKIREMLASQPVLPWLDDGLGTISMGAPQISRCQHD